MNKQEQLKYMVRVSCMTYNHVNYITDAMNGFTMQETNFPYVCTILDDASTDGEQEVIKKYLQEHFDLDNRSVVRNEETDDYVLAFAQHKTNRNCYFAVLFLKYNHYSIKKAKDQYIKEWLDVKYIAFCEGDDYWTDPQKIQKQVDFLKSHSDYVATAENALVINSINKTEYLFSNEESRDLTVKELIIRRRFATASVVCRRDVYVKITDVTSILYDTMTWCFLCSQGKFRYNNIVSSVYRRGMQGITEYTDKYVWATIVEKWNTELRRLFCPKYIDNETIDKIIWNQYRIPFECGKRKTKLPSILKMYKYGSFLTTSKYLFRYLCRRITRFFF